MPQKKCIVCNSRGKRNSIGQNMYFLCEKHNVMVELDTIDDLLLLAEKIEDRTNDLEGFIQACYKFKNEV